MEQGLSLPQAAKLAGVTHRSIQKARDGGKIAKTDSGKIDVASLETWMSQRRAPRGGITRKQRADAATRDGLLPAADVTQVSADSPAARNAQRALEMVVGGQGVFIDRAAAELARDSYTARLKQIEYEAKSGKLLDAEAVGQRLAAACNSVRSKLLAIPAERAPALHRLKTVAEVQDHLHGAIVEALEELARHFAAMTTGA